MIKQKNLTTIIKNCEEINKSLKNTTCCFTGHRPQSLPWRLNENDPRCLAMKKMVKDKIKTTINNGYINFICGMALGFDIICAEILLELKKDYPYIKIIGALPCKTQDKLWKDSDKKRYKEILKNLDRIRCIYDEYIGPECMLERNRYMVNNSSLLIALFNGKPGGTMATINYARTQNLKIIIINPNKLN